MSDTGRTVTNMVRPLYMYNNPRMKKILLSRIILCVCSITVMKARTIERTIMISEALRPHWW